jgi:hypothetical protein
LVGLVEGHKVVDGLLHGSAQLLDAAPGGGDSTRDIVGSIAVAGYEKILHGGAG